MDTRSPLFKNVATVLVGILFANPVVSLAADLALDAAANSNTSLGQAGNGVPIVNIATPNGSGLSHNKFTDYNVNQQGLILNNATSAAQSTQLGGIILGNSNLKQGAAGLILNEITGSNPSHLRGYTEVAGQSAGVIVANPHGIACDGCGFINMPRVTLSTGTPIIDQGALRSLDVNGGEILIHGAGLNATNVDQFDLITRSARINADLHANQLNIVTGRNVVDADTLTATAKANDGSDQPLLALDSSALGGMYAGAIRLVGTEQGVGVRLAGDLAAHAGDIQIDANGQLTLSNTAAAGNLRISADNAELTGNTYAGGDVDILSSQTLVNQQSLAAAGNITVEGQQIINQGVIDAGIKSDNSRNAEAGLSLTGQTVSNSGTLIATRELSVQADELINSETGLIASLGNITLEASRVDNRGGEMSSAQALSLTAEHLDNSQAGQLIAGETLSIGATHTDNSQNGLISGWQGVVVTGETLNNSQGGTLSSRDGGLDLTFNAELNNSGQGALVSSGDQTIRADSLDNRTQGIVSSEADIDLQLSGTLSNQDAGLISAAANLTISADAMQNQGGQVGSGGTLLLTGTSLDNHAGQMTSSGALTLALTGTLLNREGHLVGTGPLRIDAQHLDNRNGYLASQSLLSLFGVSLTNAGGTLAAGEALDITLSGALDNRNEGLIFSQNDTLSLTAGSLDNDLGALQSQGALSISTVNTLSNRGGKAIAQQGNITLNAAHIDNSTGGLLNSLTGWLRATTTGLFGNQGGTIQAQSLAIEAGQFDNVGGHLSAIEGDSRLVTGAFVNQGGGLFARQGLYLDASSLDNHSGRIGAQVMDFSLAGALTNTYGLIEARHWLAIASDTLSNANGMIRALGNEGQSRLHATSAFNNTDGLIEAGNARLVISGSNLQNLRGLINHAGDEALMVNLNQLGLAGGEFITNARLSLNAANWTNTSTLQAQELDLNVDHFVQSVNGKLLARDSLSATGHTWANDGVIVSDGDLDLSLTGGYSGNGRLTSAGDLALTADALQLGVTARIAAGGAATLSASQITNRGRITALDNVSLHATTLNNHGTLGSAANLAVYAQTLLNQNGLIFSGYNMALRVNQFTNTYADVYSLGQLSIAQDDSGNRSALIENRSATLESAGAMSIAADTLNNVRDNFVIGRQLVSGNIDIYWDDVCDGRGCEFYFTSVERHEDVITQDSPTAFITSGADLTFAGGAFNNLYSTVSSAGNLQLTVDVLNNVGAAGGEDSHLRSGVYTRDRPIYWNFIQQKNLYNSYSDPASPQYDPGALTRADVLATAPDGAYYETSGYTVATSGSVVAPAIIQAAGNVTINASQQINNSVVRAHTQIANGGSRVGDTGIDSAGLAPVVAITAQLPPDMAQQQVNPVALPGFTLPVGANGLFRINTTGGGEDPKLTTVQGVSGNTGASHRYLIETNPALTDLRQFMSSDYLLGQMGYNADTAQRRLGDGLYEQRLVRDAIVARTGQRYLAGMTSDEDMFRHLMDNALASKEALGLSLGISLTAEQVAALTHDIVWMEEYEVMGERVLVPVLYLAQAEGRLAPNGALIHGQDVTLISGGDLTNQGTLRATQNLSASGNTLTNNGLIQAGDSLQLLAIDSIRNTQGGVVAGRDVSAIALTGDIINERSVTTFSNMADRFQSSQQIVNNAARIEATGDLSLSAGRDVLNIGSTLQAGGAAQISAGRDVVIASQQEQDTYAYQRRRVTGSEQTLTQHGSDVQVSGDLMVEAGRDIAVIASTVETGGDMLLSAGDNLLLAAAANEQHDQSRAKKGDKKTTIQLDQISQQGAALIAGGSLAALAGNDVALSASSIQAGSEAYLYAGRDLNLLAAEDLDYSLYDMQKKGSWGRKETQRDEVTDVRSVGSSITTGGDLTLVSEGNQLYQGARLDSAEDLTLQSGGLVTFEAVKDLHQESHEKSKSDWAWNSAKGQGTTDETLRQSVLIAQGNLAIRAAEGLQIDVKEIDQHTVSQTIDAMVQADPDLAWLKQMEQQGDVDWRTVKEIHDSFEYSHSGLGVGAQLVIAIAVAAIVGPAVSGMAGGGGLGAAAGAAASGAATNASVSFINNRGDLGAVFKDVTSSDAIKGYATSALAAGVTTGYLDQAFGVETDFVNHTTKGFEIGTIGGAAQFGSHLAAQGAIQAGSQTLINGGSFSDNLEAALTAQVYHLAQAITFNAVGDFAKANEFAEGGLEKVALHALTGGLISKAMGQDFATGALAAGANEMLIEQLSRYVELNSGLEQAASQIVGAVAAGVIDGDVHHAAELAKNATAYNRQLHIDEIRYASDTERVKRYAEQADVSEDAARQELLRAAAAMVDNGWAVSLEAAGALDIEAVAFLRSELFGSQANLFQVTLAEYNNERVGLKKMLRNREAVEALVRDIALVDPYAYRTNPEYFSEVMNAKGQGSADGVANLVGGFVNRPVEQTVIMAGALACPSCALNDLLAVWNEVKALPEELSYKGFLDTLHIMQGGGAAVVRSSAASSTELGIGLGLAAAPGVGVGGRTRLGGDGPKSNGGVPDFYTSSSGETIPATGYRYVSSDAPYLQDLISSGEIPANTRGTYISFDALGQGAASKLQVPHDAAIRIEFDTRQILDDVQIPKGQWGNADYLEPITSDFVQYGPGGATQAITGRQVSVDKIIDTRTGKVLYERKR
ncbi:hypothetical protein LCGC14_0192530 [marine sediment metagenome]